MSPCTSLLAFVLLLVTVSVQGNENGEEMKVRTRRNLFQCKRQNESCRGFPRCCGTLHCHWEAGYNPLKAGVCAPCRERTQICQLDSNCCQSMVCQKSTLYDVDGACDTKRDKDGQCYRDGQCNTGYCHVNAFDVARGSTGTCQDTPT